MCAVLVAAKSACSAGTGWRRRPAGCRRAAPRPGRGRGAPSRPGHRPGNRAAPAPPGWPPAPPRRTHPPAAPGHTPRSAPGSRGRRSFKDAAFPARRTPAPGRRSASAHRRWRQPRDRLLRRGHQHQALHRDRIGSPRRDQLFGRHAQRRFPVAAVRVSHDHARPGWRRRLRCSGPRRAGQPAVGARPRSARRPAPAPSAHSSGSRSRRSARSSARLPAARPANASQAQAGWPSAAAPTAPPANRDKTPNQDGHAAGYYGTNLKKCSVGQGQAERHRLFE